MPPLVKQKNRAVSQSFIPSTTSYWNSLPMCIRNADSLNSFKSQLKSSIFKVPRIPQQFISSTHVFSVLQCRIWNNCSNLNNDLFLHYLRTSLYESGTLKLKTRSITSLNVTNLWNNGFISLKLQEHFIHLIYSFS